MANTPSNLVANSANSPNILNNPGSLGGRRRAAIDSFAIAAGVLAQPGATVQMVKIPSKAILTSFKVANSDMDTGTTLSVDIGVYSKDMVTIYDSTCVHKAVTQLQGAIGLTELYAPTAAQVGMRLWELAGITTDPHDLLSIAAITTGTATTQVAGTFAFEASYIDN